MILAPYIQPHKSAKHLPKQIPTGCGNKFGICSVGICFPISSDDLLLGFFAAVGKQIPTDVGCGNKQRKYIQKKLRAPYTPARCKATPQQHFSFSKQKVRRPCPSSPREVCLQFSACHLIGV